jgi:hypothetical protein
MRYMKEERRSAKYGHPGNPILRPLWEARKIKIKS